MGVGQCKLCKREGTLVKAHIIPIGFFRNLPKKGLVRTYSSDRRGGRKLQNALWDAEILCQQCEEDIMAPLDKYAIRILRDKEGAECLPDAKSEEALVVFENINRAKLRRFFASLLWRMSVSQQKEVRSVNIDADYLDQISEDLRNENASLDYIDAVVFWLTDRVHSGFILGIQQRMCPLDTRRDTQPVNGWLIGMPNLVANLSLDKRRHPGRVYFSDPHTSTSLHPECDGNFSWLMLKYRNDEKIHCRMGEVYNGNVRSERGR